MELILEVVSSERFMLGDNASHRFLPAGGVIGRSSGCDWVIPDQTRHISGRHAIISYDAGQFYITDISTNGVFLNGPDALPRNVAVPLQDEDRLMMGEHQFKVRVQMEARAPVSVPTGRPSQPVAPVLGQGGQGVAGSNPMAQVDAFIADRQQQSVSGQDNQDWHRKSVSMPDQLRPEQEAFTPPKVMSPPPVHTPPVLHSLPPLQTPPQAQPGPLPDNWMDLSIVPSVSGASLAQPMPPTAQDDDPMQTLFEAPLRETPPVIPNPGNRITPPPSSPPSPPPVSHSVQRDPDQTHFDPMGHLQAPVNTPAVSVPPAPPVQSQAVAPPPPHVTQSQAAPSWPVPPSPSLPPKAPPPVAAPPASSLMAAFAEGLGLNADDIAKAGGEVFMKRAGALLRQCMQGMVSNAQARASLKNEFRLDMTLVNPRANNPIKFSAHGDQVVRHLLSRDPGSFLSVEEAVQECNEDFQHHQLAMMAGMQQAFTELMQQLSPDELERRFERLRNKGLRLTGKGTRYWEAYREFHQELQEEDDIFASLFMEPFARAYDEQIKKLKQSNRKKGESR